MDKTSNVPKVAERNVGTLVRLLRLPDTMVLSFPSPYIITFHLLLSMLTFWTYAPAVTYITNLELLFFGTLSTASLIVRQSPDPFLAMIMFGLMAPSWRSRWSARLTQAGNSPELMSFRWPIVMLYLE